MSEASVEIVRRYMEAHPPPQEVVPVEFIDAGDAVVMRCRVEFAEIRVTTDHWSVFRVRDGKVADWLPFAGNKDGAREAAGLSELGADADG
jgi:hypothetical protein